MSFFDSIPQPPPPEPVRRAQPAFMQPDAVIPGSVPGELLLIRTEEVAVAIGGICAYPNGFEFTAHVRMRGGRDVDVPGLNDPFDRFGWRGLRASGDVLRLGLLYADGRRGATTGGPRLPDVDNDSERLFLLPGGGGGSDRRWDGKFWVHPLPPDGPVTFVASWPEYGVAETRAELDGAAIRAAAARAVVLWPEETEIYPGRRPGPVWSSITAYKADEPGSEAEPDRPQH
ncbi:MAG: hypothetical protein ACLPLP_24905 [Mycobacterium sp.]